MPTYLFAFAIMIMFMAWTPPAGAADLIGRAKAIDGDTLEIAGKRIDLSGIDAPEEGQVCPIFNKTWDCGREAAFALAFEVGNHWIVCNQRGRDAAGGIVAVCTAGPFDLAEKMVRKGWALVDESSPDGPGYRTAEKQARDFGSGLWRAGPDAARNWRQGKR